MGTPVIVEAVRTPIGKRNGWLSGLKATEVLRHAQIEVIKRAGIEPAHGRRGHRRLRHPGGGAGLERHPQRVALGRQRRLPYTTACTTVDAQCGSAQQANHLAAGLIAAGGADVTSGAVSST